MTFQSNNFKVDKLERLQTEAKEMEHELDNWKKEVERARKHFYDINCFTTLQLLTLRKELGKFNKHQYIESSLSLRAVALLQCLSPEISHGHVKHAVQNITSLLPKFASQLSIEPPSTSVHQPGQAKDQANVDVLDVKLDTIQKQEDTKSFDNYHMEEHSGGDKDLKAFLNESQMFVLDQLVGTMGYDEQHVLEAFQNIHFNSGDKYTLKSNILEWCENHAKEPDQSDDEDSEDSGQESDFEQDSSKTSVVPIFAASESSMLCSVPADEPSTEQPQLKTASSRVKVIRRLPVGECHPLVIELHQKENFPFQDCIKAVRFCGEDREAAEEYLLATTNEGELFSSDADDVSADSEKLSFMGGYGVPKEIGRWNISS